MMYRLLRIVCFASALQNLPASLPAEETDANAEPPGYELEVLVFLHIDKGAVSTEVWPSDPGGPSFENAISFETRSRAALKERQLCRWASARSAHQLTPQARL